MKEISIRDVGPIRIGQTENAEAGTGCTVFISEKGMSAGVDIRGGGPASRETPLLDPLMSARAINAIVFAGGSAFGLEASNGVMEYLEEKDIGYDVGVTKVPLTVQSDIFDLKLGDKMSRPDHAMGYEAARCAFEEDNYRDGNYGAGCGATIGKAAGMDRCMKAGIGSYAVQVGDLKIGAVVVVNAFGDIYDPHTGKKIAGFLNEDKTGFGDTLSQMIKLFKHDVDPYAVNTTLGFVMTNAAFDKSELSKIAGMAHDGYARAINPVHTTLDGDSIYAVSLGDLEENINLVGTLAAEVMAEAILRAVKSADSAYGYIAYKDLKF